jgi:hypothetical protein
VTYAIGDEVFRVEAVPGATPVNISTVLDLLGTGVDRSPAVSRNGQFLTVTTDRFDPACVGFECVAIIASDLSTAESVVVDGAPLRPYQGRAAISSTGDLIVYASQVGPNAIDLVATRKLGASWGSPQLLTGASPHDFNEQAVLSSDASTILFDCGPTTGGQAGTGVCEVGTDGTGFHRIIDPAANPLGGSGTFAARHADYDVNGGIVFEADWESEQLWVLRAGNSTPERVIPEHSNDNSPCALPGGSVASLWLSREGNDAGVHELKITGADGSSFFVLTPGVDISDVGMSCHE